MSCVLRAVMACACAGLLWLCPAGAEAAPGSQFFVIRAGLAEILADSGAAYGALSAYEGAIMGLDHGRCLLDTRGGAVSFTLAPGCVILANGKSACAEALRPVTAEASFWAEVWADRRGILRVIEAVYAGGELWLTEVSPGGLTGYSPEAREIVALPVAAGSLPEGLLPGMRVYVLLDLNGRVRWVKVLS